MQKSLSFKIYRSEYDFDLQKIITRAYARVFSSKEEAILFIFDALEETVDKGKAASFILDRNKDEVLATTASGINFVVRREDVFSK